MYAGRGFVCDIDDKDTLEKLTAEAKKLAKNIKLLFSEWILMFL